MLAGVFSSGVPIYGFYAMQPYLLELYGRSADDLAARRERGGQARDSCSRPATSTSSRAGPRRSQRVAIQRAPHFGQT